MRCSGTAGRTAVATRCLRGRRSKSARASLIQARSANRATIAPATPYGHQVKIEASTAASPKAISAGCHDGAGT